MCCRAPCSLIPKTYDTFPASRMKTLVAFTNRIGGCAVTAIAVEIAKRIRVQLSLNSWEADLIALLQQVLLPVFAVATRFGPQLSSFRATVRCTILNPL